MPAAKGNKYTLKRKRNPQKTDEDIDALIKRLFDFCENDRSIHINPFCRKEGKTEGWLLNLCANHPKLAEAYKEAKKILGAKVLNASFYGTGNAMVGMKYLPVYDLEYREVLKWEASLSKEEVREGSKAALLEYLERLKAPGKPA